MRLCDSLKKVMKAKEGFVLFIKYAEDINKILLLLKEACQKSI